MPQEGPQQALINCNADDVLFGGARGGGKTFGMLLDWIDHATSYKSAAIGVFFRKVAKNLEEVIAEAHRIFPSFGGRWLAQSQTYVFREGPCKGARLKFRHLARDVDADSYQGHAYTWICFEELTQWADPTPVDKLKATLRSAHGVHCIFRATANPGGAGHNWVKARYISPWPRGMKRLVNPETGETRMFIRSKLEDNRILMESDPSYERRLSSIGSKTLVRAWRDGDWDIVAGGFFDDIWSEEKHVILPFDIPPSWTRRRSFDWGSAKPGSLGMWAIADGTQPIPRRGQTLPWFPRGTFVRFGEWYTAAKDRNGLVIPNVGLRLSNTVLGQGIAELSQGINWSGCVADPSIFTEAGGPSIYKQMQAGAKLKAHHLLFNHADNTRKTGWAQVRAYLEATSTGDMESPGMMIFENCLQFIRTVPVLQADAKKPDDVDSDGEDHVGDETRYAVMSASAGLAAAGVAQVRR